MPVLVVSGYLRSFVPTDILLSQSVLNLIHRWIQMDVLHIIEYSYRDSALYLRIDLKKWCWQSSNLNVSKKQEMFPLLTKKDYLDYFVQCKIYREAPSWKYRTIQYARLEAFQSVFSIGTNEYIVQPDQLRRNMVSLDAISYFLKASLVTLGGRILHITCYDKECKKLFHGRDACEQFFQNDTKNILEYVKKCVYKFVVSPVCNERHIELVIVGIYAS